jgi:hypothetical protein
MTRRAKMVAGLAALVVVAVVIAVVALLSHPEVEVKFVGWETNGKAKFVFTQRSERKIRTCIYEYIAKDDEGAWTRRQTVGFFDPPAGYVKTNVSFQIKPPRNGVWRAVVAYERTTNRLDRFRDSLRKAGVPVKGSRLWVEAHSEPIRTPLPPR